jgi:hypothetical protein
MFTCGLSDLLLLAVGSLVVFVLREYILIVHILKTYAITFIFSTTLLLYKLDTLLLKQNNLSVLDITGFFFRIRTQGPALVLRTYEHSNTFQSDLNEFVEKINKIFIDTSQETFGNKIYYKEKSSKVNRPWFKYNQ